MGIKAWLTVLLASTFHDYYVFSYSGGGKYMAPTRSISGPGVTLGCMSLMAGTMIALVSVIAWFGAVRRLWRSPEAGGQSA